MNDEKFDRVALRKQAESDRWWGRPDVRAEAEQMLALLNALAAAEKREETRVIERDHEKRRADEAEARADRAESIGLIKGIEAAQDELVKRDQFSSRTLEILDELIVRYRKVVDQ